MRHPFVPGEGFQRDIDELPQAAKEALIVTIRHVLDGEERGRPLDARTSTADLSDCRKVYFDYDTRVKPRYRFVYQETPQGITGLTVVAIAVGKRDGLDAYLRAARNLGRD